MLYRYLTISFIFILLGVSNGFAEDDGVVQSNMSAGLNSGLMLTIRNKKTVIPNNSSTSTEAHEREKEIKKFILITYSHLANDILVGYGEYLDALFDILKIEKKHQERHYPYIKSMLLANNDIVNFANVISSKYLVSYTGLANLH